MPHSPRKSLSRINLPVLIGSAVLLLALMLAGYRQHRPDWFRHAANAEPVILTPTLTGKPEMCLTCHQGIEEISAAHPVDAFGCVICHGGDRLSLDEATVHDDLIGGKNPSDLAAVEQGCGGADCHSGSEASRRHHISRVERTIQSTYAGAINQTLLSFGLVDGGYPYYGIEKVGDNEILSPDAVTGLLAFSAADFNNAQAARFESECLTCHLRANPVEETYYYRGTGCAACHVIYNPAGVYQGADPTISREEPGHMAQHRLTTQIPYTTCNACHHRGSYSVDDLTFTARGDLPAPHELPADSLARREILYYPPGREYTLCEVELDCIDCHTSNEAMGDGDIYISQHDARQMQCRTCHGTPDELPEFMTVGDPNHPASRRATLNPFYEVNTGAQVLLTPGGDTLGAVQLIGEQIVQIGKVTGNRYIVPVVMGSGCKQDGKQQEAAYCRECHSR